MGYTLSNTPKVVKYSPSEKTLFNLLARRRKPQTIKLLAIGFFDNGELPYYAETLVGNTLRSLRRKMKANKESIQIDRIKKPGNPIIIWKLKRNGTSKA